MNPTLIANNRIRDAIEGIGQGGIAALHANDGEGMVFPHEFVSAALTIYGKMLVREFIAVRRFMSASVRLFKHRQEQAGSTTYVHLRGRTTRRSIVVLKGNVR